jgi:hypothetical protein
VRVEIWLLSKAAWLTCFMTLTSQLSEFGLRLTFWVAAILEKIISSTDNFSVNQKPIFHVKIVGFCREYVGF